MNKRPFRIAVCAAALLAPLCACSGIDLGDNPGPAVDKQTGPLTVPPDHLKDGSKE